LSEHKDYIIAKGDVSPDILKNYFETEKLIDKERKGIRYEKKKKVESEAMMEK
jgi:hypothetical protein